MTNRKSVVETKHWKMIWSDEFEKDEIDLDKWDYELGFVRNNEPQEYTREPKNSYIENGCLIIKTIKDGDKFTSASLMTKGRFDVKYGRIEMRAKLPGGPAIWPAFWTLGAHFPETPWPACGEIDIMEMWGGEGDHAGEGKVFGNAHWTEDGTAAGYKNLGDNYTELPSKAKLSEDFHIYAVEWDADEIKWYFDDNNYLTMQISTEGAKACFNVPHYILVNTAISPEIGGDYHVNSYPQKYFIDYVRVYQQA